MKTVFFLVSTLVSISSLAADFSHQPVAWSQQELLQLQLCTKSYCQGNDEGESFKQACDIPAGTEPILAYIQPEARCFCPCIDDYLNEATAD